jgi:hypothetical protein
LNRELNALAEEKDRFAMDVNTISEMQSDMLKIIETMEKELQIPADSHVDQNVMQRSTHSVDERRFSMYVIIF